MVEPETEKAMTKETSSANKEVQQEKAASAENASDDNIISVEYIKRADGKTVKRITRRKVVKRLVKKSKDDASKAKNTTLDEMEPKSPESTKSVHVAEAEGVSPQKSKNEGTSKDQWSSLLAQSHQRSMPDSTVETTTPKTPAKETAVINHGETIEEAEHPAEAEKAVLKAENLPLNTVEHPVPELNETDDDFHEANDIQETKTNNDALTGITLSKGNELNDHDEETQNMSSSSKKSSDGNLPVPETKESKALSRACKNIICALVFFALCAGPFLYFVVFDNADTRSRSSVSNSSGGLTSTTAPTWNPTKFPSNSPTVAPTISGAPTISSPPSDGPSNVPSKYPTVSHAPSIEPTSEPSRDPSSTPTSAPTSRPSNIPSTRPTISNAPSKGPTRQPSSRPTTSTSPSTSPTNRPSSRPTTTPSVIPTVTHSPTKFPTRSPTRFPTTSPSASPTLPPEKRYDARLRNYLENDFGVRIESNKANEAISVIVEEVKDEGFNEMPLTPKIAQRYAMVNMELALYDGSGENWGSFKQDECTWTGIACNGNQEVTHIRLLGKGLLGTIPSEIGMLKALVHLDLASNGLQGTIPEELYDCLSLQKIFLYKNRLSGTISDKIIDLWDLAEFNLSTNLISGRIPTTMRSTGRGIFKIRYFNVYDNQMTGPMPAEGSRLRQLFLMDLGRNRFSGRIPPMDEYVRLRHLYLDHNDFTGQLPQNIVNTGDDRLESLMVNDNRFTGRLPGEHRLVAELKQFTAQNNQFSSMTGRTCTLNVMDSGEMTEFKTDCNICTCGKNSNFCRYCYN